MQYMVGFNILLPKNYEHCLGKLNVFIICTPLRNHDFLATENNTIEIYQLPVMSIMWQQKVVNEKQFVNFEHHSQKISTIWLIWIHTSIVGSTINCYYTLLNINEKLPFNSNLYICFSKFLLIEIAHKPQFLRRHFNFHHVS